jgi:hypothetical protein
MPSADAGIRRPGQRPSLWRQFRIAVAPRAFIRRHQHDLDEPIRMCRAVGALLLGRRRISDESTEAIDLNAIPYRVLVSLEQHQERRRNALRQFAALGIDVAWKIPVKLDDVPWRRLPRIYRAKPTRGSHATTFLSVLDEVERIGAPSFLHFEDDVVFHPRFATLLARLRVPRDWQFIYLGGRNGGTRSRVSPGLVRSDLITDLHAVIIRSSMIRDLRRVLLDPEFKSVHLDMRLATLHRQYPAYLCRPNLAWQSAHSNDEGKLPAYSNYYFNGTVRMGQGD